MSTDPNESPEDTLDLAKHFREASIHKQVADGMGEARERRQRYATAWGVALALAFILAGLSLAMHLVSFFR